VVPVRRHARNRNAYLACGGLVLAVVTSAASAADQQSGSHDSAPGQESTASPQPPEPASSAPLPTAYVYPCSCEHPKDAEQDNLCIQRRAAKAAYSQAVWAARTFWVGVGGTIAVVVTLFFTAVAARAAQSAADASTRQANLAELAQTSLERPYVFVAEITLHIRVDEIVPGYRAALAHPPEVKYNFVNHGRTPAIVVNVSQSIIITYCEEPSPKPDRYDASIEGEIILPAVGKIDRGYITHHWDKWLPTAQYDELMEGRISLFFQGKVNYADVHGARFETAYCFKYHPVLNSFSTFGGSEHNYRT
jgi:hypothetical protein